MSNLLGRFIQDTYDLDASYEITYALRMYLYLFLDMSDLAALTWNNIDLKKRIIRIDSNNMHIIRPLSKDMAFDFSCLKVGSHSEYVFSLSQFEHISTDSLVKEIKLMGYSLNQLSVKSCLQTANAMLNAGYDLPRIGYYSGSSLTRWHLRSMGCVYSEQIGISENDFKLIDEWSIFLDWLSVTSS